MALSNMLKEPRRELTESGMGIFAVIALYCVPGLIFAQWLGPKLASGPNEACQETCSIILSGILIWPFVLSATIGLVYFTHFIGEEICDSLQNNGIHLRPKRELRW